MRSKTVVILGGGIGGMIAANRLRERLSADHRIVVVERNAEHAFAPSFLWLMTGDRTPQQIQRPLAGLLRRGVELVQAEALGIELSARMVRTSSAELTYDYLIIALGANLAPDAIPGLADTSHTFFTFDGAAALRDALNSFTCGRIAVVVSALPYKCPGAPYEGAMLIADYFRKRRLADKVEIHLFTPESQPMPVAGPQLGAAVSSLLAEKGIKFYPLQKLTAVDAGRRELCFGQAIPFRHELLTTPFRYDLLISIPPHRAPYVVVESGLTNQAGWVPVDRQTLRTGQDGVYAIGDVTAIPIPGRWKPDVPLMLPKAGVFAHAQAEVVAARISAEIDGRKADSTFCGEGYCMLEAGEDLAGFAHGNFFAEPSPQVNLRQIGKAWHIGKVMFERWWLASSGWQRNAYGAMLKTGGWLYGIPITV